RAVTVGTDQQVSGRIDDEAVADAKVDGQRRDRTCRFVDATKAAQRIDQQVSVAVEPEYGREIEIGGRRRNAVALARSPAGVGLDVSGGGVDTADDVIVAIGDEDVSGTVDDDAERIVELCVEGRAAV